MLTTLLRYEILRILRCGFAWVTPLLFFVMIIFLFPFALGTHNNLLAQLAPAIIWIAALLATLLSIDSLFVKEWETGCLDHVLLSSHSLTTWVSIKIISHWVMYSLPLIVITPLLGLFLPMSFFDIKYIIITLLLGTPVFTLLGAVGAALIMGIRHHGLLLPILMLPLYIPVLIFGISAITRDASTAHACFAIMMALLLVSIATFPFLIGTALRIGVES